MALSVRTRFEVFKRDEFTCQYCGRRSPEVVLEVDHIVPQCDGGGDEAVNLTTSCWDCNHGKAGVPLEQILTGEDPNTAAILLLERERQLREYNVVLANDRARVEEDTWELWRYWQTENGRTSESDLTSGRRQDINWLRSAAAYCPKELIKNFMDLAQLRDRTEDLRYVGGCVRNWRERRVEPNEGAANATADADIEGAIQDYVRATAIEQVFVKLREAEHWRRSIGRCIHEPPCAYQADCAQRQAQIWLGVKDPYI